ncbi:UdgX family uracil-DNA binding protein [Amantichitinum ursilacus]|uniref:Type-4 uracil-DNA glycosylase n=1 Tax=Amantichitinum ursilacus TaxID=857265 RepID=A0A0N0XFQ3_9NEIS|nr:UdgX family uracil-DNA binding protein [Amantichitinum ursilacus]KPC49078.1 Uracil DNA glycosylase superfamily protein [Amantichitinum ursilacus]
MRIVTLAHETDFAGWRAAARQMAIDGVAPEHVAWCIGSNGGLFADDPMQHEIIDPPQFSVSKRFMQLCQRAALHTDPDRFAFLYRLLWRLRQQPQLLDIAVDPDVVRATGMAKAVQRDMHKMTAFVRFREIDIEGGERFMAWFEPTHHIVMATAPFFTRRFANMVWSILTPETSVHWDGQKLHELPGAQKSDVPAEDANEDLWRTYYASIFNPARLKVAMMQSEMPRKYWRNLPEATLIQPLINSAAARTQNMVDTAATDPRKHRKMAPAAGPAAAPAGSLRQLQQAAAQCKECPLWQPATQTVFGEGNAKARLMLVGEQPGDQEDLAGHPFVGPAGQLLDRALEEAGLDRASLYVTNAVKHFKFELRGKRRIHSKPGLREMAACQHWLDSEIAAVKPDLIVALGATAAQSLLGHGATLKHYRGQWTALEDGRKVWVTVHPSYLLRLPDPAAKAAEYAQFVEDLRQAAAALKSIS